MSSDWVPFIAESVDLFSTAAELYPCATSFAASLSPSSHLALPAHFYSSPFSVFFSCWSLIKGFLLSLMHENITFSMLASLLKHLSPALSSRAVTCPLKQIRQFQWKSALAQLSASAVGQLQIKKCHYTHLSSSVSFLFYFEDKKVKLR